MRFLNPSSTQEATVLQCSVQKLASLLVMTRCLKFKLDDGNRTTVRVLTSGMVIKPHELMKAWTMS